MSQMEISTNSSTSSETNGATNVYEEYEHKVTEVSMKQETSSTGKISFNVIKQRTTKIVAQNKLIKEQQELDEDEDKQEEDRSSRKRGILSFEDGIVISTEAPKKKKEKVFIIPVLKLSSQAQIIRLRKLIDEGIATEQDKARLELLLESSEEYNAQDTTKQITLPTTVGVPTIVEPDEVDPDYESMPVGQFGLAFLRGCGWKDEKSAIGKTNAQVVPLRITKPRPKGLGLGATLPEPSAEVKQNKEKVKANEMDEVQILGKNSFIKCTGGLNKGTYGQVRSMDEENSSIFVEITWPPNKADKTVCLSQFAVECISEREYLEQLRKNSVNSIENGKTKILRI